MNKVSTIVTCYNDRRWVNNAIKSVINQTYRKFKIIIVDDGSNDGSHSVIKEYTDSEKVEVICHSENRGLPAARNTGIRAASGDLVAFLDADDKWRPQKLKSQVQYMRETPEAGAVYSDFTRIDEAGEVISKVRPLVFEPNSYLENLFIRGAGIIPSSIMVRQDCFEEVGLFDEELDIKEEIEMWMRISSKYEIHHIGNILVYKRKLKGSLGSDVKRAVKTENKITEKMISYYPHLRELVNKRKARINHSLASYCLRNGETAKAQRCASESVKFDKMLVRAYVTLTLASLPFGLGRKFMRILRKVRDRTRSLIYF